MFYCRLGSGITEVNTPVEDDEIIMDDENILMLLKEEIQKVNQIHSMVEQAAKMYVDKQ